MNVFEHIAGADRLTNRFGGWPSFHDAEVVRLVLDRQGSHGPTVEMLVHTWLMTDKVDERGCYILEKRTLVRFLFEQVMSMELAEFNHQNVLFGLTFATETVEGQRALRVALNPSYGLGGSVICSCVVVADVTQCDEHGRSVGNGKLME